MDNKIAKRNYTIFSILFVVLNVAATYLITTETFNRYIIPFDYSTKGVINSIIGNTAFILILLLLVNIIARKLKTRVISLLAISFALSGSLFAINVYNRYYGTSFSFKMLSIFKNPSEGFGLTIFYEALREIITYYRIILFIPFIVLLVYYLIARKQFKNIKFPKFNLKQSLTSALSILILFVLNIGLFSSLVQNEPKQIIDSAKATYGTQNIGLYNFLIYDLLGLDFETNPEEIDLSKIQEELNKYNKNKDVYTNIIDNKQYTKSVQLKDINNINGKLVENLNDDETITGILKDYNVVIIHLESFNYFLLENPEVSKYFYNLKALLEESYVFNNFYTNVGVGTSFDAELSILSGLYANGVSTLAWDFNEELEDKNFDFTTIPKLFKEQNYHTNSFHGNTEEFYNRINVHPKVFGFNEYHGKETILDNLGYKDNHKEGLKLLQEQYQHDSGHWLSDRLVFNYMNEYIKNKNELDEKFLAYNLLMMPHTPFYHDPYYPQPKETDLYSEDFIKPLDIVTIKYLNFVKYYNEIFRIIFEDVNGYGNDYEYNENNLYNHKKTAYVFYGDHGSFVKNEDVNYLLGGEFTTLEIRQKLLQTLAFIYVPGDEIVEKEIDGQKVYFREGLLKGKQNLVRSQIDLYRTIVDIFDLPIKQSDFLFGVHGFSNEPSYSIDNKSLYVVSDLMFTSLKNSTNYYVSGELGYFEMERIKAEIIKFKKYSDYVMNNNLYKNFR